LYSFQGTTYLQAGISRGCQCQFVYEELFSNGSQDGQEEENDNAVENVQAEDEEDFGQRIRGVGSFWEARFETKHVKRDERDLARAV
jgi:hypothetical protein